MSDLANNPTATGIATCAALGAFAGASYAMLTRREDQLERYAARWSVYGGHVRNCDRTRRPDRSSARAVHEVRSSS
ncbi:MAG: hypothetical protein JOY58_11055 [Solirubrobacterales bacterium]|nr:hypothetical protein [Solirubrobacterales bacterium]